MTSDTAKLTVLYVEDDEETRQELSIFLRRRVRRLILAADGREGLALFQDHHPDVVIADLLMPGLHGIDMLEEMRAIDPDCRFIITSSVSETDSMLEAIDVGIVKYIIKPIDMQKLDAILKELSREHDAKATKTAMLPEEKQRALESEIKKQATLFLKQNSGKGPRDTSVFLSNEQLEIIYYDVLNPMEKTLMRKSSNASIVEQSRRYFYLTCQNDFLQMLQKCGVTVADPQITITPKRGTDKLTFRITEL
ncbi:MAG: DUF2294 family protein [Firmicutes bacterium]|nr:DUF2294 family protein [Bacillota bacterium]